MKYKLLCGLLLIFMLSSLATAQEPNHAALVVALEGGLTVTRCVAFEEEQISGFELLNRSGLAVEAGTGGLGTAVCRIEETGCASTNCFCQCKGGGDCRYWSYWHFVDQEWQYAQVGAGSYLVGDGAIEGWTWGPGSVDGAVEPPVVGFSEVCSEQYPVDSTQYPVDSTQYSVDSEQLTVNSEESSTANRQSPMAGYVVFGLIVLGLGGVFVWRRRGK